jgi:hypothetical protein
MEGLGEEGVVEDELEYDARVFASYIARTMRMRDIFTPHQLRPGNLSSHERGLANQTPDGSLHSKPAA